MTLNLIIQIIQMSNKFSNTGSTFGPSSIMKQEQFIREIVQDEIYQMFQDIKIEIEAKIKSIDRNIIDLRGQIRKIYEVQKQMELSAVMDKMDKIEAEMKILKYHQQFSLRNSRSQSLDKERKPIFKKQIQGYDFSSVILGLENQSTVKSDKKIFLQKKESSTKPPLPKSTQKIKSETTISKDESKVKRNPILDSSDNSTIKKWLSQNNNRQSSCFSSIIREEQIEESVFY